MPEPNYVAPLQQQVTGNSKYDGEWIDDDQGKGIGADVELCYPFNDRRRDWRENKDRVPGRGVRVVSSGSVGLVLS